MPQGEACRYRPAPREALHRPAERVELAGEPPAQGIELAGVVLGFVVEPALPVPSGSSGRRKRTSVSPGW